MSMPQIIQGFSLVSLVLLSCYSTGCANPSAGKPTLETYSVPVFALTFCADGKNLATGAAPWIKPAENDPPHYWGLAELKVWKASKGELLVEFQKQLSSKELRVILSLIYVPHENLLVSYSGEVGGSVDSSSVTGCGVSYWNLASNSEDLYSSTAIGGHPGLQKRIQAKQINKTMELAISADGRFVAETNCGWMAGISDLTTFKKDFGERGYAQGPDGMATCAAISPDNKNVASGGGPDMKIVVWEIVPGKGGGKILATLQHNAIVNRVGYTADGKILAALDEEGTLKLWNLGTRKEHRTFQAHQGDAFALAVSPDGKIVATGGVDKSIKLWDTATGKELASRPNQKGRIQALAFSPDGKLLASSACDPFEKGEVKLWETAELMKK